MTGGTTGDTLSRQMLLAFGIAFALGVVAVPVVIALARRIGFVAKPRADRWSSRPTALMGGIGIFIAACVATAFTAPDLRPLHGLGAAALIIFAVGLADDVVHMRPQYKLLAQVVAGCVILASNIHFGLGGSPYLTLPLTLLFIVGITNAMNLLDNMDGLAAGVSLVSALVLGAGAFFAHNAPAAIASGSIAGACLAFLIFNFHPARVFMGDCGSMFLGLVLAVLAVQTSDSATTGLAGAVLFPSIALAIPIFDTVFVTVMRKINGRSISQGGCDHTSHRLVKLGLSEPQAVMLLCGTSLVVGVFGLAAMRYQAPYLAIVGSLAGASLLVFGRFLAQVEVYPVSEALLAFTSRPGAVLAAQRLYKRHTGTALMDTLLAFAAYLLASLIGGASLANSQTLLALAPWAVIGAAAGLGIAGVYKGVWHHLSMHDVARFAFGTALAGMTVFAVLVVAGHGAIMSVRIGILDAGILMALLVVARGLYRGLTLVGRTGTALQNRWLLVASADALGPEANVDGLLKDLQQRYGRKTAPAGIVTSSALSSARVDGVPLLGTVETLESVLCEVEAGAVLVTAVEAQATVEETCRRRGVRCIVAADSVPQEHLTTGVAASGGTL
ncbi:MAG: hypothetical protein IT209_09930 [Armatimonadetes bacterium]|nr:hypothetical protein [Armatimonadota bacterium]